MDVFDQKLVCLGVEVFEAEVLQLALDLGDTEAPRERGINIQRLLRHFQLPLFGEEVE